MDTGSDSPVLIVQRPHNLSFSAHQPLADFALSVDTPSHRTPPSATNQEPPSTFTMSQSETPQIAHPTAHSAPSEAAVVEANTTTMASTAVELATTSSGDSPPATTPSTNTTELSPQPDSLQETQADAQHETSPAALAETDAALTQPVETSEPPQDPPTTSTDLPTEPASQPPPSTALDTPPPPALVDPVTPPENTEPPPPPAPQASEPPDWMNIEEDTSTPDEEELKSYEGRMQSTSALDVKHHEELFYPDVDDPEQRPVKKIRLTWVIKGVRGTKEKPNTARVVNSPAALVDGFYWSIRFFPRGNNASALSAYIKCTKKQPKPDSNPPESTFSFVQGGPDTDLSELKPEAELTTPPPVEQEGVVMPSSEDSKPEEDVNKNPAEAENSRPTIASEGADKSEDEEDEDEEDWRVSAQIGMIIYNPQEPRTKYDMSSEHQFNKHNDDWGWTNFHGPWTEIPRRRPGQHQALLRNDTIAMDAYIRVFEDPTQALWWHESQEYEKYWDSKSLAGYFPMGTPPLYHSPGVAGITAWLLLAPFRKVLQSIDTSGWRRDSAIRPQPLLCQIQLVLYMMRKMKKEENYVNVNNILELMDMLGESHSDVISFWEAFRRSIELELKDPNAMKQISEIFDGRTDDGQIRRHTDPITIDVEKASSVQGGLENELASLKEKQEFPKFFPIALGRDKFDTNVREWKLLYNRVKLDEEIDVSQWANDEKNAKYTLYGFVAHVGERSSGKFYSILRPNGPGTKWLAFEDGDGNKVFSYTRHRIQEFEGLEGEELKTNKSTRQTAYLVMYIRTDMLSEFLPGALEPFQMASWLRPYLAAPCHSEDEPNEAAKENNDFETAIEIYPSTSAGSIKGSLDMYTLKDVQVTSTAPLKLTVPPDTTYSEMRQKVAKWQGIDNVEKIRLWKMKLGPLGEHVTASMEKVRMHRSINGSGDPLRPLCLWMHVLETEEEVRLYGDPDQPLGYDPFAKPIFDEEAVINSESNSAEVAVSGDVTVPTTDPEHTHDAENAAQGTPDSSSAAIDGEAVATLPAAPSSEAPSATTGDIAAPDAEQRAIAEAVSASVVTSVEGASLAETRPLEHSENTQAVPDAERDGAAEAVSSTVTGSVESPSSVEARQSVPIETTREHPEVDRSTPRVDNDSAEAGATDRSSQSNDGRGEDRAASVTPTAAGGAEPFAAGAPQETTASAASATSQVTTPRAMDTTVEGAPTPGPVVPPLETPAVEAEASAPTADGLTSGVPATTATEDQDADEAMIAALIVADLEAVDREQPPQDPTNVNITPAPPLPVTSDLPTDAWDIDLTPPPPQAAAVGDVADNRSEGSSANEEPARPVPHVYGFIQLFDAVKQEFRVHSTFIAKESAIIKDTVRRALGYPEDKEFSVWTRQKSYRTAAISTNSAFEALDFRSDGFVLIVGDIHSDST
jgi:hypothetical protein